MHSKNKKNYARIVFFSKNGGFKKLAGERSNSRA